VTTPFSFQPIQVSTVRGYANQQEAGEGVSGTGVKDDEWTVEDWLECCSQALGVPRIVLVGGVAALPDIEQPVHQREAGAGEVAGVSGVD